MSKNLFPMPFELMTLSPESLVAACGEIAHQLLVGDVPSPIDPFLQTSEMILAQVLFESIRRQQRKEACRE